MSKPDPLNIDQPAPVNPQITQVQIGTLMGWLADRPPEPEPASQQSEPPPVDLLPRLFDRLAEAPPQNALEAARARARDDSAESGAEAADVRRPVVQQWAMSSAFVLTRRRVVRPASKFTVSSYLRADPDGEDGWRYGITQSAQVSVDLGVDAAMPTLPPQPLPLDVEPIREPPPAPTPQPAPQPAPAPMPAPPPPPATVPMPEPEPEPEFEPELPQFDSVGALFDPQPPAAPPAAASETKPVAKPMRLAWLWLLLVAFAPLIIWIIWRGFRFG